MTASQLYDAMAFGRSLRVGQSVMVAWGYGSGFRALGRGEIVRLNRRTVRVRLTESVPAPSGDPWTPGTEISVVRPDDITNERLNPNNTVHPL